MEIYRAWVGFFLGMCSPVFAGGSWVGFPPGFKWCVATSAHQIEGNNSNSDWWNWEKRPGTIKKGERSGRACDHWNRIEEDTRLLSDLNVSQYRFSVEWAKLEPQEGRWDAAAWTHYRDEIRGLRARGIEPLVTLHHFTFPQWVADRGGWEWDGVPLAFGRFSAKVASELGEGVRDWVTINEPLVMISGSYLAGLTPPQKKDIRAAIRAMRNQLRSHAAAYREIHQIAQSHGRSARVGVAAHLRVFDPASAWNPLDRLAASQVGQWFNWAFLDAIQTGRFRIQIPWTVNIDEDISGLRDSQDYMGVNYYSRDLVKFTAGGALWMELQVKKDAPTNDLGWEIYPHGLYRILHQVADRYPGKPILITENGLADQDDDQRVSFLKHHLWAVHEAIQEGIPVEGYCHWSLMDNFEWVEGFEPRFGLYAVDYKNFERFARPSAQWFSRTAAQHGFELFSPRPKIREQSQEPVVTGSRPEIPFVRFYPRSSRRRP